MRRWLAFGAALGVTLLLTERDRTPPAPANRNRGPLPGGAKPPKLKQLSVVSPMNFKAGATWLAEASIPWPFSGAVTRERIADALEAKGLLPIRIDQRRPDYWPVLSEADWYVVLSNTDKTKPVDVPSQVRRLWEATA